MTNRSSSRAGAAEPAAAPPGPPAASRLARRLAEGGFALTAEVTPPVSGSAEALLARARPLAACVDAVNVTDGASARVHMSSLAAAALLAADGIEPVLQLTCRDRNRIALQSDLLGASALGARNLLILRGDDPTAGDQPEAKPVFDLDSAELVRAAARMRDEAALPTGRKIDSPPRFFIGAADTPTDPPPGWRPDALRRKLRAGAQFVQTQLCFDAALIRRWAARLAEHGLTDRLHVLVGIGPLTSARSARWMREKLWGVTVPDRVIARMDEARDPRAEGIAICAELLRGLAETPGVAGAHLMVPGDPRGIPEAVAAAGLARGGA